MFFYSHANASACLSSFLGKLRAGKCQLSVYVLDADGVDRGRFVPEVWTPGCNLVLHPMERGGMRGHSICHVSELGTVTPVARFVEAAESLAMV